MEKKDDGFSVLTDFLMKAPEKKEPPPPVKAFVIECRTGCSCCSDQNHYRGPFSSKEVAEKRVLKYSQMRLLASQYAANGIYHIQEHEAEVLPDGRIIVEGTVFPHWMDNDGVGGYIEQIESRWI